MSKFEPSELSLHRWGQGARENVSYLSQLQVSKTKEQTSAASPPTPPPAARSSSWACSLKGTVPKTLQKQQAEFFITALVLGSTTLETSFQYVNEESSGVMTGKEKPEKPEGGRGPGRGGREPQ